jgi:hypothetical protein
VKVLVTLAASVSAAVAVLGVVVLVMGLPEANGAPQEAALSAMVLAGVIPFYVVARCLEIVSSATKP